MNPLLLPDCIERISFAPYSDTYKDNRIHTLVGESYWGKCGGLEDWERLRAFPIVSRLTRIIEVRAGTRARRAAVAVQGIRSFVQ
jgi:hypothetical protein